MSRIERKLKSLAELQADGWTIDLNGHLTYPGRIAINKRDLPLLGGIIYVEQSGASAQWRDARNIKWSRHAFADVAAVPAAPVDVTRAEPTAPVCRCPTKVLFDQGCQCGAFAAEMALKRSKAQ